MGCCVSRSSSPYPTVQSSSSSRAINGSPPASHSVLPRPSTNHTTSSSQGPAHAHGRHPALGERFNNPLRPHVWRSKSRHWTRRELDRERQEFFETRVAGRPEIWMTLRAALEVLWLGDGGDEPGRGIATAQTILDAAGITLPTGDLANGAYDAFGAAYGMPEWVVADPQNIVVDEEVDIDADKGTGESEGIDEEEAERRREEKGKTVLAVSDMIIVKARLSVRGGADVVVHIGKRDTVRLLMKRIVEEAELPPSRRIKIVYLGFLLKENETLLAQGWKDGHVVNALVFDS